MLVDRGTVDHTTADGNGAALANTLPSAYRHHYYGKVAKLSRGPQRRICGKGLYYYTGKDLGSSRQSHAVERRDQRHLHRYSPLVGDTMPAGVGGRHQTMHAHACRRASSTYELRRAREVWKTQRCSHACMRACMREEGGSAGGD